MKNIRTISIFISITLLIGFLVCLAYGVNSIFLSQLSHPMYRIFVTGSGTGTGTITSDIYGINCTSTAGTESGTCSELIPAGMTVTLTATANATSVFSGWSGSGCPPIGTCSILIDENKTVDAQFTSIPEPDYLIGWYKFTEGSGTTAYNYASNGVLGGGLLPNLTINNQLGNFWTYLAGFGSNPTNGPPNNICSASFALRGLGSPATPDNFCFGGFVRPLLNSAGGYFIVARISGGASDHFEHATNATDFTVIRWISGTNSQINVVAGAVNNWHFMFTHLEGANHQVALVRPDGTQLYGTNGSRAAQLFIDRFCVGSNDTDLALGVKGSFGDVFMYNNISLTAAQWQTIYNNNRLRYGMAPW